MQDPAQALTIIERYGVFGLHSLIVLGIGVWMCKLLQRLNDSVVSNTAAVSKFAGHIEVLSDSIERAQQENDRGRDASLAELKQEIRDLEIRVTRAIEGRE